MASKHPRARLRHIQDEIEALQVAFDGVTFETFLKSYVLRRTAEHAVLIISEAVKSLPDDLLAKYEGVDWRAVRDIGNVVRHAYFAVDSRVIWRVVTDRLPELGRVVATMTEDLDR